MTVPHYKRRFQASLVLQVFPKHGDHELSTLPGDPAPHLSMRALHACSVGAITLGWTRDIGQKHQDAQRGKRRSENQEEVLLGLSSSLYCWLQQQHLLLMVLVRVCGVVEAVSHVSIPPHRGQCAAPGWMYEIWMVSYPGGELARGLGELGIS